MTSCTRDHRDIPFSKVLHKWALSSNTSATELWILARDPELYDGCHTQEQSALMRLLPPELLLHITSFMETADLACWTLTCKRVACAVGFKAWAELTKKNPFRADLDDTSQTERWNILRALERDMPDYHLCSYQKRLRKNTFTMSQRWIDGAYHTCQLRSERLNADPKFPADRWNKPTFCEVQAVMNRHFFGPTHQSHGLPLDFLHVSDPWQAFETTRRKSSRPIETVPYLSKIDINTAIVDDELQFHVCHHLWVSNEEAQLLTENRGDYTKPFLTENKYPTLRVYTCYHLGGFWSGNESLAVFESICVAIENGPKHLVGDAKTTASRSITCDKCQTEIRYTAFSHREAGIEFVVDVWQNLGRARHYTDPGWQHCYVGYPHHGGLKSKMEKAPVVSAADAETKIRALKLWLECSKRKQLRDKTRRKSFIQRMKDDYKESRYLAKLEMEYKRQPN
jgi:hypothetical protein